jgi:thymidylate synthase ThyX
MYDNSAKIYNLGKFPEVVKGVAMAKCSRSTNTFLEDALSVSVDQAESFNERVVAGYGHESVAEMAMASPVLEDISILISELYLDLQTGHYQGKSSRYQKYLRENVVNPFAKDSEAYNVLNEAYDALYETYDALYVPLLNHVETLIPGATNAVKKARTLDGLRGLLPLGAKTNFGSRLTGRDVSRQVKTLLSSPLEEARFIGKELKASGIEELGQALVRHAEPSLLLEQYQNLSVDTSKFLSPEAPGVKLDCIYTRQEEEIIRAHVLETKGILINLDEAAALAESFYESLNNLLANRVRRQDPLPKCLRAARYRFDIVADFGAWKDLRRHRRNELFRAPFTAQLGYYFPEDLLALDAKYQVQYEDAVQKAGDAFEKLISLGYRDEAQYIVTQGHNQHWVVDLDLEQLFYICELRTAPQGHISYRRVAYDMYSLVKDSNPILVSKMLVHPVEDIGIHT